MKQQILYTILILTSLLHIGQVRATERNSDELHSLRRRVVLINLLNGLYLTGDQQADIIEISEKAEMIRNRSCEQKEAQQQRVQDVLNELENVLLTEGVVPQQLKYQVHQMENDHRNIENEEFEKLSELEDELKQVLNENQILVINTFKPCLIPPEQGRIGQSAEGHGEAVIRTLQRIREMPVQRYRFAKDYIADTFLERFEHRYGLLDEEKIAAYRKEVLKTFEQARTLSDKTFFLEKANMAQSLLPREEDNYKGRWRQLGKVGRFLLDPQIKVCLADKRVTAF